MDDKLEYYKEIQKEVSKDAYMATCHYMILKNGNPHPYGSGVFIIIDNEKFLLTAAHVTDEKENDIYVGIGTNTLLKLGGDLIRNIPSGSRKDDRVDISILKLNNETIEKLGNNYQFIEQNELGINHEFKLLPMYQSVGFPATKSKYNPFKNEIKSVPFLYTTMPASKEVYRELDCDINSNVIVHYDKKRVKDYSTGNIIKGPDSYGISGSGLWFTPVQQKIIGKKADKKLVSILTDWPTENRKYWIGTRIDIFTEVIRQKFNLNIEASTVVKVNL